MTVSPERLAAYADGELGRDEAGAVEAELERSPQLRTQLEAHRALKARLAARFAPVADEPIPERLLQTVRTSGQSAEIIDLGQVRARREPPRRASPWAWVAASGLLAASVALAVLVPRGPPAGDYAGGELVLALNRQLVATQEQGEPVRVLLSFRDRAGHYCRGYARQTAAGIACRDGQGWRIEKEVGADLQTSAEYRQAGTAPEALMGAIQDMAAGPALDAAEERRARDRNWRAE